MSTDRLCLLAVDDERSQLEDLARLLHSFAGVERVDCARDGHEALHKLSTDPGYDAIFLDVRMPDLDGIELGRLLRRFASPPQLVFVTAYDSAAVDAFELRALDYLLKPVSRRRLEEALERVNAAIDHGGGDPAAAGTEDRAGTNASASGEMVAVSNVRTGSTRLIARSSILYVQSHGDFVRIVTPEGRYLLRATLADVERRWEPYGFHRVHRQYLANLAHAVELRPQLGGSAELLFTEGQAVPVARRQSGDLSRRLRA